MIEDQAKQKLCPFRIHNANLADTRCLGSECMGWVNVRYNVSNPDYNSELPESFVNPKTIWTSQTPPQGYCAMRPGDTPSTI